MLRVGLASPEPCGGVALAQLTTHGEEELGCFPWAASKVSPLIWCEWIREEPHFPHHHLLLLQCPLSPLSRAKCLVQCLAVTSLGAKPRGVELRWLTLPEVTLPPSRSRRDLPGKGGSLPFQAWRERSERFLILQLRGKVGQEHVGG